METSRYARCAKCRRNIDIYLEAAAKLYMYIDHTVDSIILDERALSQHGVKRYLVYLSHPNDGIMLWKTIDNMPCLIEHDCEFK